jgi:Tol biopolymer transport system component
MNLKDQTTQWLTENVYATSPTYCQANNKLAYARIVDKKMQLWLYDLALKEHKQLTFDSTDKDDCTWSPCGNFLSYSVEEKGKSRIAIYNMLTRNQKFLTSEYEDCSYPAWSPYRV